jgi:hypothetical protein
MMIRPFDWRDIVLMRRIRPLGICMDSQLAHTGGTHVFQNALLDPIRPQSQACTLVARPEDPMHEPVIGQIHFHNESRQARLAFLGPASAISTTIGSQILDELSRAAGKQGTHALIAEIRENEPAFESLRRAGFAVYARQRIWRLDHVPAAADQALDKAWRLENEADRASVLNLVSGLVPGLVQQIEPPSTLNGKGLVYWSAGELLGYLNVHYGNKGSWVQPYFHPAAEISDPLLTGFILVLNPKKTHPLFISVRSYQGGLEGAFERLGFQACESQAVMVKRIAKPVGEEAHFGKAVLEGTQPEPTTPILSHEGTAPSIRNQEAT